jgi:hypothetical protein
MNINVEGISKLYDRIVGKFVEEIRKCVDEDGTLIVKIEELADRLELIMKMEVLKVFTGGEYAFS